MENGNKVALEILENLQKESFEEFLEQLVVQKSKTMKGFLEEFKVLPLEIFEEQSLNAFYQESTEKFFDEIFGRKK